MPVQCKVLLVASDVEAQGRGGGREPCHVQRVHGAHGAEGTYEDAAAHAGAAHGGVHHGYYALGAQPFAAARPRDVGFRAQSSSWAGARQAHRVWSSGHNRSSA